MTNRYALFDGEMTKSMFGTFYKHKDVEKKDNTIRKLKLNQEKIIKQYREEIKQLEQILDTTTAIIDGLQEKLRPHKPGPKHYNLTLLSPGGSSLNAV